MAEMVEWDPEKDRSWFCRCGHLQKRHHGVGLCWVEGCPCMVFEEREAGERP